MTPLRVAEFKKDWRCPVINLSKAKMIEEVVSQPDVNGASSLFLALVTLLNTVGFAVAFVLQAVPGDEHQSVSIPSHLLTYAVKCSLHQVSIVCIVFLCSCSLQLAIAV